MKYIILLFFFLVSFFEMVANESDRNNLKTDNKIIYSVCYTNDGSELAVADGKTISIFCGKDHKLLRQWDTVHENIILSTDISANDEIFLSAGRDSTVIIWDYQKGSVLDSVSFQAKIISLSVADNAAFFVCGLSDGTAYVYDLITNNILFSFSDHDKMVTTVDISPDGKLMLTGSGDKKIHLYNATSGKLLKTFDEHFSWVRSAIFTPDGYKVLSCGDDSSVLLRNFRNIEDIKMQYNKIHGTNWITTIFMLEDLKTVAFANLGGLIRLVNNVVIYEYRSSFPVFLLKIRPNSGIKPVIAVASRGDGVFILETNKMNTNPF